MCHIKHFKIKVVCLNETYGAWQINFLNGMKRLRTFLKFRPVADLQGLKWNTILTQI